MNSYKQRIEMWLEQPNASLDDELRMYAGTSLAQAGEWVLLRSLLTNYAPKQRWAEARFAAEANYSGYLGDLDLLWQHAEQQKDLALVLHCALIRNAVLSKDWPFWPESSIYKDLEQRKASMRASRLINTVDLLGACSRAMPEPERQRYYQKALAYAIALEDTDSRYKCLAWLADYHPELRDQIYDYLRSTPHTNLWLEKGRSLYFLPLEQQRALADDLLRDQLLHLTQPQDCYYFFMAKYLSPDMVSQTLKFFEDQGNQVAYDAFLRSLNDHPDLPLEIVIAILQRFHSSYIGSWVLDELVKRASLQEYPELEEMIAVTLVESYYIFDEEHIPGYLAYLPKERLVQMAQEAIQRGESHWNLLIALIPLLRSNRDIITHSLAIFDEVYLRASSYNVLDMYLLTTIMHALPEEERIYKQLWDLFVDTCQNYAEPDLNLSVEVEHWILVYFRESLPRFSQDQLLFATELIVKCRFKDIESLRYMCKELLPHLTYDAAHEFYRSLNLKSFNQYEGPIHAFYTYLYFAEYLKIEPDSVYYQDLLELLDRLPKTPVFIWVEAVIDSSDYLSEQDRRLLFQRAVDIVFHNESSLVMTIDMLVEAIAQYNYFLELSPWTMVRALSQLEGENASSSIQYILPWITVLAEQYQQPDLFQELFQTVSELEAVWY